MACNPGPRPAFIAVPNVAQLTATFIMDGQICENVYHVKSSSAWTSAALASLITVYTNWETASGKAIRHTDVQCTKVRAIDLTTRTGPYNEVQAGISGTDSSAALPNHCSLAISWGTALRGRSFRGRTYHIGLTEGMLSATSGNTIATASVTAIILRYQGLANAFNTSPYTFVVVSYQNNCAWNAQGIATPIGSCDITDPFVDSQRRRLPGHNVHR